MKCTNLVFFKKIPGAGSLSTISLRSRQIFVWLCLFSLSPSLSLLLYSPNKLSIKNKNKTNNSPLYPPKKPGFWSPSGSAAKSTCLSCRGPGFRSQHPHGTLQLFRALVPGDLTSSLISSGTRHTCGAHIYAGKICINIRKTKHNNNDDDYDDVMWSSGDR